MADPAPAKAPTDWPAEVARLNKIVRALMDRAERSTTVQGSDFGLFQTAIQLEAQVRSRTAELESALRENAKITRALRESEAKFRGLVSQSLVGIVTIEDGKLTYTNPRFDEIFGYSSDEVRGMSPLDLVIERDRALVEQEINERVSGATDRVQYTFRGLRKDGTVVDIECHGGALNVGSRPLLVTVLMDITERTRAERELQALQEALREQSTHDGLTGLFNRRYLDDNLARELIRAERADAPISVILGDLDHFKHVNDSSGHLAGDEVLRVFGNLIRRHARGSDICCRYGGEEFLLVLPGMSERTAIDRAEQLRSAIGTAIVDYDNIRIPVTASFGVATFPHDGRTGDELIAAADDALYRAKEAGRNRVERCSGVTSALAS